MMSIVLNMISKKSDKDTLINKIRNLEDDEKLKQVMRILEENDRDSNR